MQATSNLFQSIESDLAAYFALCPPPAANNWHHTARPDQLPPEGDWRVWLIQAGRGWGKTRTGAEYVREQIERHGKRRFALVGPTAADCRDVMVEGESGLLAVCDGRNRPLYEPSKRRLTWPNGAIATTYSADEPERLRGPQHDGAWCVAAGTLVKTDRGDVPIEEVCVGDRVWTRRGLRRVKGARLTNSAAVVLRIETESGQTLRATANHKVFVNNAFRRCDSVRPGDIMSSWKNLSAAPPLGSIGAVSGGIETRRGTTKIAQADSFMLQSGNARISAVCPMVSSFTIPTKTRPITSPEISKPSLGLSIQPITTIRPLVAPQTSKRISAHYGCGNLESRTWSSAPIAISLTSRSERELDSALPFAVQDSIVKSVEPDGVSPVYDLTVDGTPEFFAGDLLVHNCDEPGAWKYATDAWDMLMFGLRLGDDPRVVATTTPRPIALIRDLLKQSTTVVTRGRTADNAANLAPAFLEQIVGKYEGTRLGRQELEGELLDDHPGALWQRARIDELRIDYTPWPLRRVVVAIDPAVTSSENSDETGIVVAALGQDDQGYVLADLSGRLTADGWGRAAVNAYHQFHADKILGEVNNGGDLIERVVRTVDSRANYLAVRASRGKIVRAEPIAALYEQGRVHHIGGFDQMEDQMCAFTADGYTGGGSPDRADALVWALSELMLKPARSFAWA